MMKLLIFLLKQKVPSMAVVITEDHAEEHTGAVDVVVVAVDTIEMLGSQVQSSLLVQKILLILMAIQQNVLYVNLFFIILKIVLIAIKSKTGILRKYMFNYSQKEWSNAIWNK